jgi:putative transposase
MPRKPRIEVAGGIHHVFARGNRRQRIYLDAADCWRYLDLLGQVVARTRWRCLAYCLLDNHVHLLIETPETNLGAGMQLLHGTYAQQFNWRHGRSGHLFQGRYGANFVKDDEQLWTTTGYIAANPVTAGLCDRPEQWPWNSYRHAFADSAPGWLDTPRLLSYLGALGGEPRHRYGELVNDRLARKARPTGSDPFVNAV